jgi:hypothetical protein
MTCRIDEAEESSGDTEIDRQRGEKKGGMGGGGMT